MIKTAIAGAGGRMGKALIGYIQSGAIPELQLSGALEYDAFPHLGEDAGTFHGIGPADVAFSADVDAVLQGCDVMIDFSHHTATVEHAPAAATAGKALVVGTTGLTTEEIAILEECGQRIPLAFASNMSLGVNLLFVLVEEAARALKGKGYDIEIIERHHRRKKDAPSGTALGLGKAAAAGMEWALDEVAKDGRSGMSPGERPVEEIGFHAVRGGDIVGDHTVLFATDGECIELGHRATSRDTFALGALKAAAWVAGKPAKLYSMRDVLGL